MVKDTPIVAGTTTGYVLFEVLMYLYTDIGNTVMSQPFTMWSLNYGCVVKIKMKASLFEIKWWVIKGQMIVIM